MCGFFHIFESHYLIWLCQQCKMQSYSVYQHPRTAADSPIWETSIQKEKHNIFSGCWKRTFPCFPRADYLCVTEIKAMAHQMVLVPAMSSWRRVLKACQARFEFIIQCASVHHWHAHLRRPHRCCVHCKVCEIDWSQYDPTWKSSRFFISTCNVNEFI